MPIHLHDLLPVFELSNMECPAVKSPQNANLSSWGGGAYRNIVSSGIFYLGSARQENEYSPA